MNNPHIDTAKKPDLPTDDDTAAPIAFFQSVYRKFDEVAERMDSSVTRFLKIGGYTIKLRFAGDALVPLIAPAFEHLSAGHNPSPDLTVCLWDSVSTRTEMIPPPWSMDDYLSRGEVRGYTHGPISVSFHLGSGILSLLDKKSNLAILWIRDAGQFPLSESASPLRVILHWWMREHGRQLVHAASVGSPSGGVLLVGRGGTGKSTTALACLSSELLYAGDDQVLIAETPVPFVYSVYNSAKLDKNLRQKFGRLMPERTKAGRIELGKEIVFLSEQYADRIATGFPLKAICIPRIAGKQRTEAIPTSPAAALKALAPSTVFQLTGAGPVDFHEMARFVKRVPSYILELGADIREAPEAISRILAEIGD